MSNTTESSPIKDQSTPSKSRATRSKSKEEAGVIIADATLQYDCACTRIKEEKVHICCEEGEIHK
ncbi:hypothetical protein A2U01_0028541, partial [Trifolium medium]|nr:hypothetical protein [Trifolium medium]